VGVWEIFFEGEQCALPRRRADKGWKTCGGVTVRRGSAVLNEPGAAGAMEVRLRYG